MAKVKLTEAQLQKLKDSVIKKELEKTVPSENTPEVKKPFTLSESKLKELVDRVVEKEKSKGCGCNEDTKKKVSLTIEEQKELVKESFTLITEGVSYSEENINEMFDFIHEKAIELDYKTVEKYYRDYINPGLSDLYKFFSFGRDVFYSSEGMYLYSKSGKKILDFTGGLGVLSHGHNHQRILDARIKFQQEKRVEVHKVIFSSYQALLAKKVVELLAS